MILFELNSVFAELLAGNGLATFVDLMSTVAGTLIEANDERDVRRLELGNYAFYLKRVQREKTSAALESYLSGRRAHSRPYREMQHFRNLRANGFQVAEIAAVGEQTSFGIPSKGFILTREVPGKDLLQLYREAEAEQRLVIARRFGDLVGRLYRHGFFGSIRLKDVICTGPVEGSSSLTLIDREVRHPFPRKPDRKLGMSKLRLNFRRQMQQGEIFSARELKAFIKHYRRGLSRPMRMKRREIRQQLGPVLQKTEGGRLGQA